MNIYILSRLNYIGWDQYDAKVVVAENKKVAREMANEQVGEEGLIWEDADLVLCEKIDFLSSHVVLASFNAG